MENDLGFLFGLYVPHECSATKFIGSKNIGMDGNPMNKKYRGEAARKDIQYRSLISVAYAYTTDKLTQASQKIKLPYTSDLTSAQPKYP